MQNILRAILFLCLFYQPIVVATQTPVSDEDDTQYWQTEGYGYVIKVQNNTPHFYDVTDNACIFNSYGTDDFEGNKAEKWITTDTTGKVFLHWYALHPIELTPIETLPKSCATAHDVDADPIANFDVFWATYTDHYPYAKAQNWDWEAQYPVWRSMVTKDTSEKELANLFSMIINRVRDGHAQIVNKEGEDIGDIEPRLLAYEYRLRQIWKYKDDYRYFWPFKRNQFRKWRSNIVQNYAQQGSFISHYDNFHFARLDGHIGYLRIDDMLGFTPEDTYDASLNAVDDAMQQLLPEINRSRSLVIDLRENGGGTDLVSMRLLSYLFKHKTRIGSKYTVMKSKPGPEKPIWVTPSEAGQYTGPIVVLTSQQTASAAEIMLIGLTARENTIVIGEPSNGSFSDSLPKKLPNGWGFTLSHQVYLDIKGDDHEDIGTPVAEYIPFLVFDDLEKGLDPALERAIEILK